MRELRRVEGMNEQHFNGVAAVYDTRGQRSEEREEKKAFPLSVKIRGLYGAWR